MAHIEFTECTGEPYRHAGIPRRLRSGATRGRGQRPTNRDAFKESPIGTCSSFLSTRKAVSEESHLRQAKSLPSPAPERLLRRSNSCWQFLDGVIPKIFKLDKPVACVFYGDNELPSIG
jgi:hypothetical protein